MKKFPKVLLRSKLRKTFHVVLFIKKLELLLKIRELERMNSQRSLFSVKY